MDRYPDNGKLLKIYGRFLEYVENDPWSAQKCYSDAMKAGLLENLIQKAGEDQQSIISHTWGMVDERIDAIIIASMTGTIMMVNQVCLSVCWSAV